MTESEIREKLGKGTVSLVARNPIYMKSPFYVMAAKTDGGSYQTGQHQDGSAETADALTLGEMTGKKPLSEEKATRFPYVINPEKTFKFNHMDSFNLADFSDMARLKLLILSYKVAMSSKEYNKGKHHFFLQSAFAESNNVIEEIDLNFKAMEIVVKANSVRLVEIAHLLNYYSKSFMLPNPDKVSPRDLKAEVYKEAKNNPTSVINAVKDDNGDKNVQLLIMKLVANDIIKREGNDFVFDNMLLGNTISKVEYFVKDAKNDLIVNKWLQAIDNPPKITFDDNKGAEVQTVKPGEYIDKIKSYLFDKEIEKAREVYDEAIQVSPNYAKLKGLKKALDNFELSEKDEEPNTADSEDKTTAKK